MRLNGRREILHHLGRSGKNRRGWRAVRRDYAAVLYYLPGSRRVWTTKEELDALDRARALSVEDVVGGATGDAVGGAVGDPNENAWRDILRARGNAPDFFTRVASTKPTGRR